MTRRGRLDRYWLFDAALDLLLAVWLPAVLVGTWWLLSRNSQSFYFPPLSDILSVLVRDLFGGALGPYVLVSLSNLAIGLAIAIVLGISLGLVIGRLETLRNTIAPILNFLRAIPPASIVPIIIIALGVGSAPKIFVIALGTFWPVLLNTVDGVRGISPALIDTARAYRIPLHLQIVRVLLPAAMPQIMAGIRIALSVGLVLMVISEFFGADSGIGFYITDGSNRFAIREAWAGTILVGILGYVLSLGFLLVERRLLRWYFQEEGVSLMSRLKRACG